MEETRQHPALTSEQKLFAVPYFAGPMALLVGISFQLLGFSRSAIFYGIAGYAATRVVMAIWALARPGVQTEPVPKRHWILPALFWSFAAAYLLWYDFSR